MTPHSPGLVRSHYCTFEFFAVLVPCPLSRDSKPEARLIGVIISSVAIALFRHLTGVIFLARALQTCPRMRNPSLNFCITHS